MPVYKKKIKNKIKYYARINFVDAYGKYKAQQSKYFDTKREADIEETKLKINAKHSEKNSITFDEAFQEYVNFKKSKIKPTTLRKYAPMYANVKDTIGSIKISKLNIQQYQKIKDSLDNDLSFDYKNKIHRLIISIIRYAELMYNITNNAPMKVGGFEKDPSELKKEMNFYTHDEFNIFIKYFDDNIIYKSLFTLLYYEGLRIGEANALTWNDIDFTRKTIKINKTVTNKLKEYDYYVSSPKTSSSNRIIPIKKEVFDCLEQLYSRYKIMPKFSSKWFIFGGIKPMSETSITNKKNLAADTQKLKRIRIHDFRHSCASYYISLGANILLIAKLLGHSSTKMTMDTYSHLYPNELEKLFEFSHEKDTKK